MMEASRQSGTEDQQLEGRAAEMTLVQTYTFRVLRRAIWAIAKTAFRTEIRGQENLPAQGGFVLAPGAHRSILDAPMASLAGARVFRYMGAESYFDVAGLGLFLRSMGGFPVERSLTDRQALRISEELLSRGEPLVVFPEGTRQDGHSITEIRQGAAFLAARAQVPIVPVGLGGAARSLPIGAKRPKLTKLAVVVGEPIQPPTLPESGAVKRSAITSLSAELQARLQELFEEAQTLAGVRLDT